MTQHNKMLRAALEYQRRGWSLIPMAMADKRPAVRWKRYQTQPASESTLRKWFSDGKHGIGVVFGEASGGLLSRDFDTMESYERWANDHADLAEILPTVATSRGRHVYATATAKHVADVRYCIGKPDGTGAIVVADGELRCGAGCYSVLPPSVHPSGAVYRWEVPLPNGPLPEIDVFAADFYQTSSSPNNASCNREHRENGDHGGRLREQRNTEAIKGDDQKKQNNSKADPRDWSEAVQWAVVDSVPEGSGQRHRQVFELARGLKAVPELADAEAGELKSYVRQWHKLSLDKITTKPFTETWIDFLKAWPRVKHPKGADPMTAIFEQASGQAIPEVAQEYDQQSLQLLVALCRELQRSAGSGPFYLSCRTAGRLLDVDHTTANRWLFLMISDGILEIAEPGDRAKRKAARYRYLPALCPPILPPHFDHKEPQMIAVSRQTPRKRVGTSADTSVYSIGYTNPLGAPMSQTVRIRPETHAKLKAIAEEQGKPLSEVLDDAVEVLRRQRILEATDEAYAAIKKDPKAWKAELAEREAWDKTLSDGMEGK